LQLAGAGDREREVGIRGGLGASRWRMARLLTTESVAVGLAGGAAGITLAALVIKLIRQFAPGTVPHLRDARLDVSVLLFALGISLATGILFGLAPVLAAFRVSLEETLKETAGYASTRPTVRRPHHGPVCA